MIPNSAPGESQRPLVSRLKKEHLALISANFAACLTAFEEWHGFTGPSIHFYSRALERRRQIPFCQLGCDAVFLDAAYAALTSWGMHRMGPRGAKLTEFGRFAEVVREFVGRSCQFSDASILDLDADECDLTAAALAPLLDMPGVVASASPSIVGNSKLLHFILPELVPPIDRRYTLRAFFGRSDPPSGYAASEIFRVAFAACAFIASGAADDIRDAVKQRRYLCASHAKVVDNAIVGFMRLRSSAEP